MLTQEMRARRTRMARRRPAPKRSHVRSRSPAQRRQRSDWAKWTAVVTAAVAAGGLLFTGVVTYWGMRTAQDQLAQSREDQEKDVQRQASLVTSWVEQRPGGLLRVLVNRSSDPIFSVQLDYEWDDPKAAERMAKARPDDSLASIAKEQDLSGGWDRLYRQNHPSLGSEVPTQTQVALEETFLAVKARHVGQIPPCSRVEVKTPVHKVDTHFIDSQGAIWVRTSEGALRPEKLEGFSDMSFAVGYSRAGLLPVAPPKVTKIECGEAGKP
jgi:hypothetical protein